MDTIKIILPTLGESLSEATVAKWLKNPGDLIEKDEAIVEIETDKATQELYAESSGTLSEVYVQEGSDIEVGAIIGTITPRDLNVDSSIDVSEQTSTLSVSNKEINESSPNLIDIIVPSLGESILEANLSRWLKKEGDLVESDTIIVELETDKATQEIYAGVSGKINKILVDEGKDIKIGQTIGKIQTNIGENKLASPVDSSPKLQSNIDIQANTNDNQDISRNFKLLDPNTVRRSGKDGAISSQDLAEFIGIPSMTPAARRMINEKGINPLYIDHEPNTNSIKKEDVQKIENNKHFTDNKIQNKSHIDVEQRDVEQRKNKQTSVPMTRLRQTIANRLLQAQKTAALLTTFNEVDMSQVMQMRKKYGEIFLKRHGTKLGFMSFFVKAVVTAINEFPILNAAVEDKNIIYNENVHIGIAVGAPKGLLVPVLREAENKSFHEIESEIKDFGIKAQEDKISVDQMMGGTFTISNGGVYGSMMSTPIVNPPQSAILGLHNITERPVAINGEVVVRPMMYLAVTYDHRIIDGKEAVSFLVTIKNAIEDPERLLLNI